MSPVEEAAEWFVSLQGRDGSDLPTAELKRWERWIVVPANRAAFDRLAKVWDEAGVLEQPRLPGRVELAADRFRGDMPVSQWLAGKRRMPRYRFTAAAAAIVGAAILAGVVYWNTGLVSAPTQVHRTDHGEHRNIRLPDGSTVILGANSVLAARYDGQHRTVVLDSGEALFEVARDAARPFVVRAGKGTITALGTAFNVLHNKDRVTVTVTEGKVEVRPAEASAPAQLDRGKQVTYAATGRSEAIVETDPLIATAWLDGRLRYRGEPLGRVVEDVNRYWTRQIVLDPALSGLEFTGVIFRNQIPGWIDGLPRIFPVEVVDVTDDTVLIRPHPAQWQ